MYFQTISWVIPMSEIGTTYDIQYHLSFTQLIQNVCVSKMHTIIISYQAKKIRRCGLKLYCIVSWQVMMQVVINLLNSTWSITLYYRADNIYTNPEIVETPRKTMHTHAHTHTKFHIHNLINRKENIGIFCYAGKHYHHHQHTYHVVHKLFVVFTF